MVTKLRPFASAAGATLAATVVFAATPAHAGAGTALLLAQPMMLPQAAAGFVPQACDGGAGIAPAGNAAPPIAKSVAILGGETSALEQMRASQGGSLSLVGPAPATSVVPLRPAAVGLGVPQRNCPATGTRNDAIANGFSPDDFLASKRVRMGKTQFDGQWRKVSRERLSRRAARRALTVVHGKADPVAAINAYVNKAIEYREDRDLFGKADHWAGARRTLALGKGDCEDIAIVKMQLLLAAGYGRDDLVLTLARDTVRRNDHALLMVRRGEGWIILDNGTDTLLDGAQSYGYRPIVSFGAREAWIHGV